ncbi:UBX domain-containing protein 8 [Megalops cyprinoides]|uniref:UBX domain-containing protein 8 n=1 Tax=Megalops cyprinoides TaxID=118141 RepID=UPI00186441D8|nr:UBX domain-containing protein 8 [Megalops cyprinoides]
MSASRTIVLFAILSLSLFCYASMKSSNMGVKGALLLAGRGLFLLCLSSWLVSVLYPWIRSSSPTPRTHPEVPEEEVKRKQELARKEQQEKHSEKASSYQESVLKPRQEFRLRKKEEHFYRMTGEAWKLTQGQPLGEGETSEQHSEEEEEAEEGDNETPNQKAVRRRKLPESATRAPPPPDPPQPKRVVVLPDEPPEDAEGVVRVALRCPSGRTVRRKFLKSHNSLVLVDWLLKTGYHPAIYTICTSYPRTPLQMGKDLTLEDAGIRMDTVLNVEEKDPSMT